MELILTEVEEAVPKEENIAERRPQHLNSRQRGRFIHRAIMAA